jgi:hypothetical protein
VSEQSKQVRTVRMMRTLPKLGSESNFKRIRHEQREFRHYFASYPRLRLTHWEVLPLSESQRDSRTAVRGRATALRSAVASRSLHRSSLCL